MNAEDESLLSPSCRYHHYAHLVIHFVEAFRTIFDKINWIVILCFMLTFELYITSLRSEMTFFNKKDLIPILLSLQENGYQLLFLSARAIVQAYLTRSFLLNIKQVSG